MFTACSRWLLPPELTVPEKVHPVDIGYPVGGEHKRGPPYRVGHTLVATVLPAAGNTYLDGVDILVEVAVGSGQDFVSRPRIAGRHARGSLCGHCLVAAETGLYIDVGVGEVDLDHMKLQRVGWYVVEGVFRTRAYVVRLYEGIDLVARPSYGQTPARQSDGQGCGQKQAESLFHKRVVLDSVIG